MAKAATPPVKAQPSTPTTEAAAPLTIAGMTFEETDVETPGGRTAEPNEYLPAVKRAVDLKTSKPGKGLAFTVTAKEGKTLAETVKATVNKLRRASQGESVSLIIKANEETGRIEFRAMDKITRPRKDKPAEAATEATPTNAATSNDGGAAPTSEGDTDTPLANGLVMPTLSE